MTRLQTSWRWIQLLILCVSATAEPADIWIRHGTIVDGTGRPGFSGDVAITGGRIVKVGNFIGPALREVDATGLVIAPGFIDAHTHAEGIFAAPEAENFVRMGVTTVVMGNCGASAIDIGELFRSLERTNVSINVATLIGHNDLRRAVMGETSTKPASAAEMARMQAAVEQAMQDGAMGFSTGLIYTPGKFAPPEEIIELAKVAARHHGLYATHVRDEQEGLMASLDEAFNVARAAKIPLEISHLKISGNLITPQKPQVIRDLEALRAAGWAATVISKIEAARKEGLNVTQDLYAYSAATASLDRLLPFPVVEAERRKLEERLADPAQKEQIAADMKKAAAQAGLTNYDAVIISIRRDRALQTLTLVEAAKKRRGSSSLDAQIDLILEIEKNGGASIIIYGMNEDDLLPFMRLPQTMFASDTGTFQTGNENKHPRGYGNSARILARYVREEKLLSLEEAVRRMTSLPSATFQIKDRGVLREGAWADLVVFDPRTVQDNATYEAPHLPATGFKSVLVNGIETVANDAHTHARGGRPVRRGQ